MNIRQVVDRKPIFRTKTGYIGRPPSSLKRKSLVLSRFTTPVNSRGNGSTSKSSTPSKISTPDSNTTDSDAARMILVLCEGRGEAREVIGIAALDICRPALGIYQVSDTQGYNKTLMAINTLNPVEVLVPSTLSESRLVKIITEKFRDVVVNNILRRFFDATMGLKLIQHLCASAYANSLQNIQHKYYALSAAAALLKYLETAKQISFNSRSLKITYLRTDDAMAIDCDTAYRLELVASTRGTNKKACLLGILNHCITKCGKRFLRANILQPLCNGTQINLRLAAVEELSENPDLLIPLQMILPKFINVDSLLTLCIQPQEQRDTLRAAEIQINYILLLKGMIAAIPALLNTLENSRSALIKQIYKKLSILNYETINENIIHVLHDDATPHMGYLQKCYVVKPNVNELLDLKRTCYSELIDNARVVISNLAEEYNLPLTLTSNNNKGFHIMMKMGAEHRKMKVSDFPDQFVNIVKHPRSFSMTTIKIIEISRRLKSVLTDIQILTNSIIECVLNSIREDISSLYILCESISELDILQSLAEVAKIPSYCRPTFSTSVLNVIGSRHPMLEYMLAKNPVANNIMATESLNFHIITGPNMSGKSIYIKQIALLHIMAQIGSFVPAISATFRITDMILARINFDDSIECNASNFQYDIREMQYILNSMGPSSLVIIDELCRGTVFDEGSAIAWVLCEQFLDTSAFVFCATHFISLTKLAEFYLNVTNFCMETTEREVNDEIRLTYTYCLKFGVTDLEKYGLAAARASVLPKSVVDRATEICNILEPSVKPFEQVEQKSSNHLKYNFISNLTFHKDQNNLTPELLHELTTNFKQKLKLMPENDANKFNQPTFDIFDTKEETTTETMDDVPEHFVMNNDEETSDVSIPDSTTSYNFLDMVTTVYSGSEASGFKSPYPIKRKRDENLLSQSSTSSTICGQSLGGAYNDNRKFLSQNAFAVNEKIPFLDKPPENLVVCASKSSSSGPSFSRVGVTSTSNENSSERSVSRIGPTLITSGERLVLNRRSLVRESPKVPVLGAVDQKSSSSAPSFTPFETTPTTSVSHLFSDENNDQYHDYINNMEIYKPEPNFVTFRCLFSSDK